MDALRAPPVQGAGHRTAFTLVELLVVIGILSALMAVTVPALNLARSKVLQLKGSSSLRQVASQLLAFANDHDDRYPPSVATIGAGEYWTWYYPRRLVGPEKRTPVVYRSMSAYLRGYIDDADVFSCPSATSECGYLQQMWDAGEDWDNPATTTSTREVMTGSFCYFWNYEGLLDPATKRMFRGPWGPASGRGFSQLLACDHLGYGNGWDIHPSYAYASCEPFDGAIVGDKADVARWISATPGSGKVPPDAEGLPKVTLKAVFADTHVERYHSSDVMPMWVIVRRSDLTPYKIDGTPGTPGLFFLPRQATPAR